MQSVSEYLCTSAVQEIGRQLCIWSLLQTRLSILHHVFIKQQFTSVFIAHLESPQRLPFLPTTGIFPCAVLFHAVSICDVAKEPWRFGWHRGVRRHREEVQLTQVFRPV